MKKQIVNSSNAPAAIGPYSHSVKANGFLFVSGQIPRTPQGEMIMNTIEDETHQVMRNVRAILEENSLTFDNVVKSTIFLKNMDDFAKVNTVYGSYFVSDFPARETVQVAKLPMDVNVEISVVAVF
ncbi:MAG: RidA family protein [Bacteroidia bacterium]|nr:RidA family protein [Bacteroidia bacterium]